MPLRAEAFSKPVNKVHQSQRERFLAASEGTMQIK